MSNSVLDLQRLPEAEMFGGSDFWATITGDEGSCSLCTHTCANTSD